MFRRVLIANRGAIAVRIIRTLKKLGIQSVVIFNEDDRYALHVKHADEAYSLGEGTVAETYLNQDKILRIATENNVEAIHPGYGFLSENAEFVEACAERGIVFIGPRVEQMAAFGLKHSARALAQKAQVALLPGTELLTNIDDATTSAESIGYPVMLKSTAGGGGIGMQICRDKEELIQAYDSVKRLSANNFSNDGVFLEKYIQFARHIEVQIFGDGCGRVIALGERDCSTQRRHQKVVEETPAPNLSDATRKTLSDMAVRLAQEVNYENIGTVEFVVDQQTEAVYFLEVNTRLQVEHGVTEAIFNIDLVEWMLKQAAGELDLPEQAQFQPQGHALQVRIYAENPHKQFRPSAGLLSAVVIPELTYGNSRIDTWVEGGMTVSSQYDPMLAKVIVHAPSRDQAVVDMQSWLAKGRFEGIETNREYLSEILRSPVFNQGQITTTYLNTFEYQPSSIDVLSPGTMTTVQDYPGRIGYWDVGIPPSGPFDHYAFVLGNQVLKNHIGAAGLEITLNGPSLQFNCDTFIALTGASMDITLDEKKVEFWRAIKVEAGQILRCGKIQEGGARTYLLVQGGIQGEPYLGSQSTFTLGKFGGFSGRALLTGDVLHVEAQRDDIDTSICDATLPSDCIPTYSAEHNIRVIYGPHGAPDFFDEEYIDTFFSANWQVHYNSSRTGVRLIGPKPKWARTDGGEAGMHPSNIHDNAYAIGAIDFTGDMPVILGPDGPSLGGFVCPATVIGADLWKLGQLKAGDTVRFFPVSLSEAKTIEAAQREVIKGHFDNSESLLDVQSDQSKNAERDSPILASLSLDEHPVGVVYRASGDKNILIEYGDTILDIRLRFRVHVLMLQLQEDIAAGKLAGVIELTPGIRSLQIHFDNFSIDYQHLLQHLLQCEEVLGDVDDVTIQSRVVHLPLSWDDEACQIAIEKYMQSVRKDAPWCPSNLELIRRINGLDSIQDVKDIVFSAEYVVMGLGDVYLGAPVATPLDPRKRLVTTKYNPARTWTAENSVGIGGSYLCVYGMEGPGGYQFVGRTLQMWNRYHETREFPQPWLLRFFDQIRFYEVSHDELTDIRASFLQGDYPLKIEETTFSLKDYDRFMSENQQSIETFVATREKAYEEELSRWVASGQMDFSVDDDNEPPVDEDALDDGCVGIDSPVAGNVWQYPVNVGDSVKAGDVICVLESMKMEIEVHAVQDGEITMLLGSQGTQVKAGQRLAIIQIVNQTEA